VGGNSGSFNISTSAGNAQVSLSCEGIDSNLDIAPSPAAVPTTRVGEPRSQTITVRNTGAASLNLVSAAIVGDHLSLASMPRYGTYNQNDAATFDVMFAADAPGDATGTVTLTYDGGQTRTLSVSATAQPTSMSISPDVAYDLGAVCVGANAAKDFSIVATEAGPFAVTAVEPPDEPFTLITPALPGSVQGAGANMFTFTAGVAPTAPGPVRSSLTVQTDIPGGTAREISLTATGIPDGVNGPSEGVNLGGAPLGTTTLGRPVSITNCGTASVTLSNARIEPADNVFAIVQPPEQTTLAPGEHADWLVIFKPTAPGEQSETFNVDTGDGATVQVQLLGDGLTDDGTIGDPNGTGTDKVPSYYACSAGGSTAMWPIGLALAGLIRKRRRSLSLRI
jgi:MYXO-CTERM domain-containing protein